jgi:hypothetical protein
MDVDMRAGEEESRVLVGDDGKQVDELAGLGLW